MKHLYLHIPFCKSLCPYCDFYTIINTPQLQSVYTDALLKELKFFVDYLEEPLETIYFGGGTPSILAEQYLIKIFSFLNKLKWADDIEITFEANPLTISSEKCKIYKGLGINRVSLGTQSFVDSELKTLGRQHRNKDNYQAFENLRKAGINNINLDLLIGTPGQDLGSLDDSINQIISLEPEHISPYILTYYENTVYTKMADAGKIIPADNDTEADFFDYVAERLDKSGFLRYEISNFAKSGFYSRHNMNTWHFGDYLGVGCAAHSFFDLNRRANASSIEDYLKLSENSDWLNDLQLLSKNDEISEYIMLALRTVEGLDTADFQQRFKKNFRDFFEVELSKHAKYGLLKSSEGCIRLSKKGMDLFNLVVSDFIL